MPKITDEELQRLVEQQLKSGAVNETAPDSDEYLYGVLFNALSTEQPLPDVPSPLAESVVNYIEREKNYKESLHYNLAIAAVIIGSTLFTSLTLLFISPPTFHQIVKNAYSYKWIISFILVAVAAIEIVDRKLIRKHVAY